VQYELKTGARPGPGGAHPASPGSFPRPAERQHDDRRAIELRTSSGVFHAQRRRRRLEL